MKPSNADPPARRLAPNSVNPLHTNPQIRAIQKIGMALERIATALEALTKEKE